MKKTVKFVINFILIVAMMMGTSIVVQAAALKVNTVYAGETLISGKGANNNPVTITLTRSGIVNTLGMSSQVSGGNWTFTYDGSYGPLLKDDVITISDSVSTPGSASTTVLGVPEAVLTLKKDVTIYKDELFNPVDQIKDVSDANNAGTVTGAQKKNVIISDDKGAVTQDGSGGYLFNSSTPGTYTLTYTLSLPNGVDPAMSTATAICNVTVLNSPIATLTLKKDVTINVGDSFIPADEIKDAYDTANDFKADGITSATNAQAKNVVITGDNVTYDSTNKVYSFDSSAPGVYTLTYTLSLPQVSPTEIVPGTFVATGTFIVTVQLKPNAELIIDPTSEGDTKITGTGNPGDNLTVTITSGGVSADYPVTVKAGGNWTLNLPAGIALLAGDQILVSGSSGINPTATSSVLPIVKTILTMYLVYAGDKTIAGTGNKGDIIDIFYNGQLIGSVNVGGNGNWQLKLPDGVTLYANYKIKAVVQSRPGEFKELIIANSLTEDHIVQNPKAVKPITDPYVYIGGTTTDDTTKKANKTDVNTTSAKKDKTKLNAVIYLKDYTIKVGDPLNFMKGVTAKDNGGNGKDLTKKITIKGIINTQKPGIYVLTYSVKGENGVTVARKANITVVK